LPQEHTTCLNHRRLLESIVHKAHVS
jgi:hypothetical protein